MPDPNQPMPTSPSFGAGKPTEATIDQVNIAMRAMPWYQQLIKSFGQDPNNVHLNDQQKQQVLRGAQAAGIQVNEGDMEVDPAGNFNPKGHKLRNTLIVAGIAGATIATMGAAGAFSGAGAAGMAGGGAGAGASGLGGAGAAGLGSGTLFGGTAGITGVGAAGLGGAAAIPAIAGGALVPTIAPGLASLSAGSMVPGAAAATGGGAAAGGGIMSRLLNPSNLADAASTAGAYSSGEKANRLMQGNFTQAYDRNMLQAQQDRNLNESDAMRKLATTSYIAGGGSKFKPSPLSIGGKSYAPMDSGYGPTPVSDAEKAGATSLQDQLGARLKPGGSYTPSPLSSYATPGRAEDVTSKIGAGLGWAGTIGKLLGYGK